MKEAIESSQVEEVVVELLSPIRIVFEEEGEVRGLWFRRKKSFDFDFLLPVLPLSPVEEDFLLSMG